MSWLAVLKLIAGAVELLLKAANWIEREKVSNEAERAVLERSEEKTRVQIDEARAIRARVRAELAADPAGVRDHPDARFRD